MFFLLRFSKVLDGWRPKLLFVTMFSRVLKNMVKLYTKPKYSAVHVPFAHRLCLMILCRVVQKLHHYGWTAPKLFPLSLQKLDWQLSSIHEITTKNGWEIPHPAATPLRWYLYFEMHFTCFYVPRYVLDLTITMFLCPKIVPKITIKE